MSLEGLQTQFFSMHYNIRRSASTPDPPLPQGAFPCLLLLPHRLPSINRSPFTSSLQRFSTHFFICSSVISSMELAFIHPAAINVFKSSSSIEALYNVKTFSSYSCLANSSICFSYSSRNLLNSMKCLADISLNLGHAEN